MKLQILDTEEYNDDISNLNSWLEELKIPHESATVKEWQTEECDGGCCSCTPCEDDIDSDRSFHCSGHEVSFYVVEWEFDYDKLSKTNKMKLDRQLKKLKSLIYSD